MGTPHSFLQFLHFDPVVPLAGSVDPLRVPGSHGPFVCVWSRWRKTRGLHDKKIEHFGDKTETNPKPKA